MVLDYDKIATDFRNCVDVRDRKFRLKTYQQCFVASEAVDFLVQSGLTPSREVAVAIGRHLQANMKLFRHVTGDHNFADEYLFFRFTDDKVVSNGTVSKGATSNPRNIKRASDSVRYLFGVKGREKDTNSFADFVMRHPPGMDTEADKTMTVMMAAKQERIREMTDKMNDQIMANAFDVNEPFETQLKPGDMRCLALVAHNHMKPAMRMFVEDHAEILKKFRLTGTNTTISMCKKVFGENDPDVVYGPTCTSGPLGGDAQLAALMSLEDVGGIIFFMDPLSPHPHQADIDSLIRLANVNNVILCPNPTTGLAMMQMLRQSLINNKPEMFPSFFQTLESPSVPEYKAGQRKALEKAVNS